MDGRLCQYLRLIRPYGMLFLGFAPVFGAIAAGQINGLVLWVLLAVGLLYHVFTFVLNDVVDVEVDAKSRYVAARPLIEGGISHRQALVLVVVSLVTCLVLAGLTGSLFTVVFLFVAFVCALVYNVWSKRVAFLEFVLGFGVFSLVLAGSFTGPVSLSNITLDVGLAFFVQWVFSVGVAANLKDIEEDTKQGVFTSPTVLGVKFSNGRVEIPLDFILYALFVSGAYILLLGNIFVMGLLSGYVGAYPVALIGFLVLTAGLLVTTWGILRGPSPSRETFLRFAGLHEGLALLLVPMTLLTLLLSTVGVTMTLLIFFVIAAWPLCWFRLLYGRHLIPLE